MGFTPIASINLFRSSQGLSIRGPCAAYYDTPRNSLRAFYRETLSGHKFCLLKPYPSIVASAFLSLKNAMNRINTTAAIPAGISHIIFQS